MATLNAIRICSSSSRFDESAAFIKFKYPVFSILMGGDFGTSLCLIRSCGLFVGAVIAGAAGAALAGATEAALAGAAGISGAR